MSTIVASAGHAQAEAPFDRRRAGNAAGRVAAIDIARLLGIFLVYYGHVAEQVMYLGSTAAQQQYKFIYSFHMPLFFILSGAIAKDWAAVYRPVDFLKSRLASRVVPLLVFNGLLGLISLAIKPSFPPIPLLTAADYGHAIVMTMTRLPAFDIPTWFLMCLVSVEILHALVFPLLRGSDMKIGVAIVVFYVAGYTLNRAVDFFTDKTNWWFWNEAITVYAFYLLGVLLANRRWLDKPVSPMILGMATLAATLVVFFTYDLNTGPFRLVPAVAILAASHGQFLLFPLTALAGSAAVLLIGRLSPDWAWLRFMGSNALILFCLNGVVYHHVNTILAHWLVASGAKDGVSVFLLSAMSSLLSLAAAVPVVMAFNRFVPQLVGRPTVDGPWLRPLLHAPVALPRKAATPSATASRV